MTEVLVVSDTEVLVVDAPKTELLETPTSQVEVLTQALQGDQGPPGPPGPAGTDLVGDPVAYYILAKS